MTTPSYSIPDTPSALIGSLLDTVHVDTGSISFMDGVEPVIDSYNCMKFQSIADFCVPNSKDFENTAGWLYAWRFAVYGGATCKAVGLDQERMQAEIDRVFAQGESTAVEQAFMNRRFVEGHIDPDDSGSDLIWDEPFDVTPSGGAVTPAQGVALLEGYMGSVYVGQPTLHLPITIASEILMTLGGLIVSGKKINTKLGSKVVAGAGYDFPNNGPDGTVADDGEKWLYATGEIAVRRSDKVSLREMAHSTNDVYVLAERAYVGVADCATAAVRVQV